MRYATSIFELREKSTRCSMARRKIFKILKIFKKFDVATGYINLKSMFFLIKQIFHLPLLDMII